MERKCEIRSKTVEMTTITLPVNDFHGNGRKRAKSSGKITDNLFGLIG